jgi:hypothetical protein
MAIFEVVFRNLAGRVETPTKHLSQYRRSPGRDLNRDLRNKNRNLFNRPPLQILTSCLLHYVMLLSPFNCLIVAKIQ